MATGNIKPTTFTNPDPVLDSGSVTGASTSGHASSTVSSSSLTTVGKSCQWSAFVGEPFKLLSATLKVDWTRSATLNGSGTNNFFIEYSLDGGSNWFVLYLDSNVTGSASGPSTLALSVNQNLALVKVRDGFDATGGDISNPGDASMTVTITSIRIEVTFDIRQFQLSNMM